ncbi:hypothetical protein ACS8FD_14295, partial [Psychrobacter sp. 1U2]
MFIKERFFYLSFFTTMLMFCSSAQAKTPEDEIKVKVFIAAMFEIGENSGDKAGEFQHWYNQYFA